MAARTISPNAADQPQTVPPLSCRKAWGDSGGPRGPQPPRARAGLGEGPAQDLEPCAAPGLAPPRPGVSCLARSMALGRPCSPRWLRRARRAAAASPVTAPGRPMTARRPRSRPRPGHSTYVFHVCLQARKKKSTLLLLFRDSTWRVSSLRHLRGEHGHPQTRKPARVLPGRRFLHRVSPAPGAAQRRAPASR